MSREESQLDSVCGDSRDRVMHATGAIRSSDACNVRYDLISPFAMDRIAQTCSEGSRKYGDFNWEKGFPVSDLLNHALRHVFLYLAGEQSEDHLAHAAWNLMAAMHSEECWPHLNASLRQQILNRAAKKGFLAEEVKDVCTKEDPRKRGRSV